MKTHRYQIADLVLETNIPLPEAIVASEKEAECRFQWMDPRESAPKTSSPYHRWVDSSGKPYAWFYHREDGYQIRIRRMADFLISTHADEIRCYPRPQIPQETIRHLFLDLVLPVALSRRGRLSLHASAVATPDGAIGFLGGSGRGKSTLAVGFSQRGFPVLCDDLMVVRQDGDGPVVVPTYRGAWLCRDSVSALFENEPDSLPVAHYAEKRRFLIEEAAVAAVPLVRLYMLGSSVTPEDVSDIHVANLSPSDAIVELIKCAHLLDVTDKSVLKVKFNELKALSEEIPCFRLAFPHDYSRLGDVCAAVIG